jgi:hypothetical protein
MTVSTYRRCFKLNVIASKPAAQEYIARSTKPIQLLPFKEPV